MKSDLKGIKVAVMGGDAREMFLVDELAATGAVVHVVGLPVTNRTAGVKLYDDPEECLLDVQAVVLPVTGINEKGILYSTLAERDISFTAELAAKIPTNIPLFVGMARPRLVDIASQVGLRLIELMKLDEVAILNSIPSAEGAVQIAMEVLPITIHGSSAYVLGFGRTGVTLSRLLGAMGARTSVVARRPEYLARIAEMNLTPVPFYKMAQNLGDADVIFNTIPALVLTCEVLKKVSPEVVIIDLASAPGGVDYQEAKNIGINAILAPGLPGKVAPKTAGSILARVITRLLADEIAGS